MCVVVVLYVKGSSHDVGVLSMAMVERSIALAIAEVSGLGPEHPVADGQDLAAAGREGGRGIARVPVQKAVRHDRPSPLGF